MKHTPLDVRHQEFASALSGYAKKDVREFLLSVADDLEEYERTVRAAQERITLLESQINELRQGEETLKRAVVSAERIANEMKLNAEREASLKIKNAEHQALTLVQEAENQKEQLLREALSKARDIRVEMERLRAQRSMFASQFKALLQSYLDNIDQHEGKNLS
ncbi:MAG: DivIVA domain-containing protein [Deinococcales bacterium]